MVDQPVFQEEHELAHDRRVAGVEPASEREGAVDQFLVLEPVRFQLRIPVRFHQCLFVAEVAGGVIQQTVEDVLDHGLGLAVVERAVKLVDQVDQLHMLLVDRSDPDAQRIRPVNQIALVTVYGHVPQLECLQRQFQLIGHHRQFAAGGRRLLGIADRGIGNLGDPDHVFVDHIGDRGLFF